MRITMRYLALFTIILSMLSCNDKVVPIAPSTPIIPKDDTVAAPGPIDKMQTRRDVPIGKIDGYEITYDCSNCMQAYSDSIIVYSKKEGIKVKLFELKIEDYYIDKAEILTLLDDTFIYIGSSHTHGHSQGYLYAFDSRKNKAVQVKQEAGNLKIPDSLYIRNWGGLAKDDSNNFSNWGSLRSKAGGNEEQQVTQAFTLVKLKNGTYILKPEKAVIE